MYDKEQKGFIPVAQFKSILKEIDSDLADAEADAIVKELDTDFSGTIEFEGEIKVKFLIRSYISTYQLTRSLTWPFLKRYYEWQN